MLSLLNNHDFDKLLMSLFRHVIKFNYQIKENLNLRNGWKSIGPDHQQCSLSLWLHFDPHKALKER